jgi:peptidoglycan/xylan/chitin deacetylase (PgdA/CDA1 family)
VAVTFDDGWFDNYETAMPIANRHHVPMAIFICPGLMGKEFPFWPEKLAWLLRAADPNISGEAVHAEIEMLKTQSDHQRQTLLRLLSTQVGQAAVEPCADRTFGWQQATAMSQKGVMFGCHTQTHQILTHLNTAEITEEVRPAKQAIESVLKEGCSSFAYPNGNHSAVTRSVLEEQGFTLAFTTEVRIWTSSEDTLAVPRINVAEDDITGLTGAFSPSMFEYTAFWKPQRAKQNAAHARVD